MYGGVNKSRGWKTRFMSRAISYGGRRLRSYVGTKPNKANRGQQSRSRSSRGAQYGNLTFQNDEARLYRRKRAPRRVRARHRRAFKSFTYNLDKTQGMHTMLIPRTATYSVTPSNGSTAQTAFGITIYGYGSNNATPGTNDNWANGDFRYITTSESGAPPTTTLSSSRFRFRSAVMNMSIENVTDNESPASNIVLLDIYTILARGDSRTITDNSGDPSTQWAEAINLEATSGTSTAVTTFGADGVTPFDSPEFGTKWIIKSCRRVRLGNGQIFNTQMRDPGNYVLRESDLLEFTAKGNVTEGYIVVFRNAMADATTGVRYPASLKVNYQKVYHYTYTVSYNDSIGRSNII